MARIALVSKSEEFGRRIRQASTALEGRLIQLPSDLQGGAVGVSVIVANQPDVVVVGPGVSLELAQGWTQLLDSGHPTITTIWVGAHEPDNWRSALQAGARDLVAEDASDDELLTSLRKAIGIHDRRYATLDTALESAAAEAMSGGRVITVASPKGGSGKTMFSTNLAYALRQETGKQVVLVDLDLQFGDVAGALHLRPEYSVLNGLKAVGDPTAVKAFLAPHPSGIFVLAAPNTPAEADNVDADGVAKLLDLLRNEFDYVVCDTGAGIDDVTLVAIEQATDLAFITTTDLSAIQALRKAVLVLDQLDLNEHRRWYFLNRADARVGLSRNDIEESTGLAIDLPIPSARSVPMSMNQGTTVSEDDPRSPVSRAITQAAQLMAGGTRAPTETSSGGSWFRRLKS